MIVRLFREGIALETGQYETAFERVFLPLQLFTWLFYFILFKLQNAGDRLAKYPMKMMGYNRLVYLKGFKPLTFFLIVYMAYGPNDK